MDTHSLSEEDIKLRYITPAILCKDWVFEDISMEMQVKLTDGKINLKGNLVARSIPLPPLSEQKRIVAKVEELFEVMK